MEEVKVKEYSSRALVETIAKADQVKFYNVTTGEVEKITSENIIAGSEATTLNTTHRTSNNGSDHSFIDQDVTIASAPTFTADNLSDGGTNAIITTTQETNYDTAYSASHARSHSLVSTDDHTSTATADQILKADANGLPVDATNTDTQVSAAVDATHARSHAITSTDDHTSTATTGQVLKADANGLPIDATNTDAQVSSAVDASHTRSHAITSTSDHTSTATADQMLKANANGLAVDATNTDTQVSGAVSASHTQNTDTKIIAGDTEIAITDAGTGKIDLKVDNVSQMNLTDGVLAPETSNDIDVGDGTHLLKDVYIAGNLSDGSNTGTVANLKTATDHAAIVTGNPHNVTKTNVGLSNVPNTDCTNASNLASGTVPSAVLPPVALTSVQVAISEVAQLALTTEEGDVVVRTDESKSYMHNGGSAGTMADFTELQTPTDNVLSVNSKTGTVVINPDDLSDVATTNKFVVAGDITKLGNLSGTNSGDDATNSQYSGLVSNVTTNLSAGTLTATTIDVNSSDGTNATLVEADTTNAGILGSDKWDEIVANSLKDTNVSSNLSEGTSTETTVKVACSDGTDATLVSASTSRAGLLTKVKWDEVVANSLKDTNVSSNLSEGTSTETTVKVACSDGTDATLVSASASRAGLLTKAKFDEIVLNNDKLTNATHTGDVTGAGALALDKTAISGQGVVTADGTDYVIIGDTSDTGALKKALISDFAAAGGDMAAATYDPDAIAGNVFDMANMLVKGTSTGNTTIASANTGASDYVATLQAATGTVAYSADITGTNSGTNTGDDKTAITGILKGDGTDVSQATSGSDYLAPFDETLTVNTGALTLTANVDDSSVLTIGSGAVSVSGANTGDQNAAGVSIADAGVIITATDVEGALQENRTAINLNTNKDTNATHSGEVTGDTALTITAKAVTYAKIQDISATDKILGRSTAGAGVTEEITCTAAGRAILDDADAAAQRTTLSAAGSGANSDITSLTGLTAPTLLDTTPASDVSGNGFKGVFTNGNAGAVAFGDVCFMAADGALEFADADQITTMPGLYMALAAIDAAGSGEWLMMGVARNDAWNWTIGAGTLGLIYVSVTATTGNTLTQTAPSATGDQVQIVGHALSADVMMFNPNYTYIEVA